MQRLVVNYKKISKPTLSRCGYSDLKEVARRYSSWLENKPILRSIMSTAEKDNVYFFYKECRNFLDTLPKDISLLDVGCGTGIYSEFFSNSVRTDKHIDYYGCEVSKAIVEICRKIYPQNHFFKCFADDIKVKSNNYDIVYCSSTIQYTLEKWRESLLEMKRVAKRFIFLVRFPVTKFHKTFYVRQRITFDDNVENHNFIVLNRTELENYFSKIGLDVVVRDYSSEEYLVEGIKEKIILNQYLLEKLM